MKDVNTFIVQILKLNSYISPNGIKYGASITEGGDMHKCEYDFLFFN